MWKNGDEAPLTTEWEFNGAGKATCTISCCLFGVVDLGSPYQMVVKWG